VNDNPENTVLRSEFDASMAGLYASLAAGGLMLAYAIYYVTSLEGIDDYSFLTLGLITGLTAISAIGMHEWFRHQKGADRPENPIEEYAGAVAVLMGALSVVWLSRFAVFYAGQEKGWIEIQDGLVWMPVWLATLQSACMLLVMEVSTRSIRRHSLGTLPRTIVILAPISLVFSGIPIWLDYSRGELEIFLTISIILMTGSAVLYSLRLDRAILYLLSSGIAVALPIYMALRGGGEIEHAGLLVPAVVLVGITATDQSLSKRMIENGSGVVVAAILFCQIIATTGETSFVLADILESSSPFGLTFWLWLALLVGWFAPTSMQRTPAMPVGLALALALLADEAALIGWAVGIAAFVYLETRPQARDWVVRATFAAMIASWWVSAAIGSSEERVLASFGGYSLSSVEGSAYLLFPALLMLGMWAQRRGRLAFFDGPPVLLLLASLNFPLMSESSEVFSLAIVGASLYQLHILLSQSDDDSEIHANVTSRWLYGTLLVAPIVVSIAIQAFDDPDNLTSLTRVLPIVAAASLYGVCHYHKDPETNLILRPELAAIMTLILLFLAVNLDDHYGLESEQVIMFTLLSLGLVSALLAIEGGAIGPSTPTERLVGIAYLIPAAIISGEILFEEGGSLPALVLRDVLVVSAPALVNYRLKEITDLSEEARYIGAATLIGVLIVGLTDASGGLLALPLFLLAVQRATKHASTQVLIALPLFAVIYSSSFQGDGSTVWYLLDGLPYLGETSNLLWFDTPRWTSLLLAAIPAAVAFYMPVERAREGGSRYGSEQLFGPAVAALMAIACLLPDERTAPILIVIALTIGSWRKGVAHWFWLTPLAFLWATSALIDFLNYSDYFQMGIESNFANLVGGMVGLSQYVLLERGVLLANVPDKEDMAPSLDYLGAFSRGFAYLLIASTGEISGALPFLTALIAGWDGLRNGIPILLHGSVVAQYVFLTLWVDVGPEETLLWPMLAGLAMIVMAWSQRDPYGTPVEESPNPIYTRSTAFDVEKDFGMFGSAFFLISLFPYAEHIGIDVAFGFSIVLLSLHHIVLGFGRDQGWRRMLSLVGLPTGLIVTGMSVGGLTIVIMNFLAALTLMGQAVLYASRGGLEIGSTVEGASPHVSEVGIPTHESMDEFAESQAEEPQEHPAEPQVQDDREALEDWKPEETQPIRASPPSFASEDTPFDIRLDPKLMENLRRTMEDNQSVDLSKWKPVVNVNSNGAIVLNWEKVGEESN